MRTILASVVLSTATTLATVSAQASPISDNPQHHASYCPRRDAYEVSGCLGRPRLPSSPVTPQLHWMLRQLSGDAATVTADEVRRHFTKPLLAQPLTSADDLVTALKNTLRRFGPMHFEGFSYPPRRHQALVLARGEASGFRAEVPISVTARTGLINSIAVSKATPVIVPRGRYSGWFDIGGRSLFLRCIGKGSPTVVFENGLSSDWYPLQNRLSSRTRVCSYDPARQGGPTSRSGSARAPRTGSDRVHDLNALLATAHVPGPYVLAAHSNGGLFSLLYASRHPRQVAGLVLIDGVHPRYHRRTFNALKHLIPPSQRPQAWKQYCAIPALQVDWEQMDICRSEAQARARLAARPLGRIPLAVIRHGVPEGPPGPVRRISEKVWRHLQRSLAALEPGSDYVVAGRSGHDIQHTQPRLVLREVGRVVAAVRAGRHVLHGPAPAVAP
jgi:pimeloyl-ACP methyl ester carboxylesterase